MHPPAKLFLREGFVFHSRPESLRARDVIRAKCVRKPVTKDVKRASSFVLRDGFRPYLDAFVHDLAEDDELKPSKQSRQLLVRFGEVRKDRLKGEMFHGFYPLRLSELINLWFDCIDCATIQDECHS